MWSTADDALLAVCRKSEAGPGTGADESVSASLPALLRLRQDLNPATLHSTASGGRESGGQDPKTLPAIPEGVLRRTRLGVNKENKHE